MLFRHEVDSFLDKDDNEIREFLTENNFNKQHLRQAIYTLTETARMYRKQWLRETEKNEQLESVLNDTHEQASVWED